MTSDSLSKRRSISRCRSRESKGYRKNIQEREGVSIVSRAGDVENQRTA
ncbi:hypothetical protein M7I_1090 [Glarea lozoyensis 74030]|uniref:Uncharacterized protein n=1 Tax=Glarea lozoyensis (strain ATCC 74030 / MF5533) TaxID=1104152 RepID=H0EF52_GLAL7|nr:hypothetical protein M7I_1090 [Glarea lozoyensis 74030]